MIPSGDLKIITLIRNTLSVFILVLGVTWLWATKQEHWLKDYMEPSAMVVGALIAFCQFLIARWSGGQIIEKNKFYNIPNTQLHRDYLAQARAAIADGRPEKALNTLADIKVENVSIYVSLLNGRCAERRREQIAGVLKPTAKSLQQISRDVLSLINALEAEMNTYGAVDKEVRGYLQKRYTNRLEQKLAKRQPINLRRLLTTEGTSDETAEAFVAIGAEDVMAHIAQVFQAAYGRLLITGKPGAGKTVLLLQLELALLGSETDQLPVILNLATWKKDYISLEPWLKDILPAELGVTKKYAADILQQNRLILLLDGLDEVEESDRVACLEAIGRYRATTYSRYVLTSRIGEYSAISKDAPVNLQIEIGNLTFDQMEAELLRMGHTQPEALPLLKALKKRPALREAAQVPFYFNTLQLLFAGGKNLSDLGLKGHTAEEIQAELTPQFVEYALTISSDKNYNSQQAERWLSFLADGMTQRNKVVFELVDLQYDWSPVGLSRTQLFIANFVLGLVFGLIRGLLFLIIFCLITEFLVALRIALIFVLFFGLVIGLVNKFLPRIETKESIKWSWERYFQGFKSTSVTGLVIGFVLVINFVVISVDVVLNGHVYFLVVAPAIVLFDYFKSDSIVATLQLTHPYERFKNSVKRLHFSFLQHWHLMYLFSQKDWLPWRIIPFLNDMVAQQLLECSDGATWRFRHRILQEYFAKKWETTELQPEKSKYE
jgi:hypothetical protein